MTSGATRRYDASSAYLIGAPSQGDARRRSGCTNEETHRDIGSLAALAHVHHSSTAATRSILQRVSSDATVARRRPAGIAEHPVGADGPNATAAQRLGERADRLGRAWLHRRRGAPGTGRSPASRDVSVSPAWASPPSARGHHDSTRRPSVRSMATARWTASALPPWPLTRTTPLLQSALRTSSTTTRSNTSVPIDSVPGKPACSPLAVTVSGRGQHHRATLAAVGVGLDQTVGDGGGDARVGVEREVRPVLLARADGHDEQRAWAARPQLAPRHRPEHAPCSMVGEADVRVGAVAQRLDRRLAAATQRHPVARLERLAVGARRRGSRR